MYKEAVKTAGVGLMVSGLLFGGCSNNESKGAEELVQQASAAVENGNSTLALTLLDSLQSAYPQQVDQQREGMKLRPRAMELSILARIQSVDSTLAAYADTHKTLGEKMKRISGADLIEPYTTPVAGYNPNFINSTGVQARVDNVGQFYLVSSMNPGTHHVSLTFSAGSDELTTEPVPYDGDLNYRMNGTEVVTFMPAKCEAVGEFLLAHRNQPVSVRFNGEKGKSQQIKLATAQVEGMADAYLYSRALIQGRELSVEREKLDRQLQVARDQTARLSAE